MRYTWKYVADVTANFKLFNYVTWNYLIAEIEEFFAKVRTGSKLLEGRKKDTDKVAFSEVKNMSLKSNLSRSKDDKHCQHCATVIPIPF